MELLTEAIGDLHKAYCLITISSHLRCCCFRRKSSDGTLLMGFFLNNNNPLNLNYSK